jgi:hypothetical protein
MAKKLKVAKTVPHFANRDEAATFFDAHDVSDVWDQMRPVPPFKLPTAQVDAIRARHAGRKTAVSLSLEPAQIRDTQRIAARKSIGYQTQLQLWIAEGIHREKALTR